MLKRRKNNGRKNERKIYGRKKKTWIMKKNKDQVGHASFLESQLWICVDIGNRKKNDMCYKIEETFT